MTKLIVCNDGTWNTPDQEENGIPSPTNVFKFYNSLAASDAQGNEQRKYYHPGVGTSGWLDAVKGGALGIGVDNQIMSAYHWLASNYEPGAVIYLLGFSRGAFVARSLAGFLKRGLFDLRTVSSKDSWDRVKTAYTEGYRKYETLEADPRTWIKSGWTFFDNGAPMKIRFVGVWDTVGALGVPDDLEFFNLFDDPKRWRFHNTSLGDHIQTARHAMAMNEVRGSFTVTRWSNADQHRDAREVWFPGVHCDVGGGYSNADLSDGALLWMFKESIAAGLVIRPGVAELLKPNALGAMHNSYKGAFAKLRSRPRSMEAFIPANQTLFDESAQIRQKTIPISYAPFRPTRILDVNESLSVDIHADTHWNDTGLYLDQGQKYTFSATGEWMDAQDACDWKGTQNDKFTVGDVVRFASGGLGYLETITKNITKNASTDFLLTKRVEKFKWFALVGAIANDGGSLSIVPNDGSPRPHEYANLPDYETNAFQVGRPGYLFCFPNDVWNLYGNNHGSVRLKITRIA